MSKEKQIEEMVTELAEAHHEMDVAWTNHFIDKEKFPKPKPEHTILAEHLYNAGYRKQSEWISVADSRKPHNLQKCFIAFVFGDSDMIFYGEARYHAFEGNGLVDRSHFSNEGVEGMTVKYWMPIPRFPEMKGGAE